MQPVLGGGSHDDQEEAGRDAPGVKDVVPSHVVVVREVEVSASEVFVFVPFGHETGPIGMVYVRSRRNEQIFT